MNNKILLNTLLNALIISPLFISCHSKSKTTYPSFTDLQELDKGKKAIVAGQISNLHVYPHINEIILTLPNFRGDETVHIAQIDSCGKFHFEIYPIYKREVSLTSIEDVIVISPGDSLYIEKDFSKIAQSRFSGDGATLNSEISAFMSRFLDMYGVAPGSPYSEFIEKIYHEYQKKTEALEQFKFEHNTSEDFDNWSEKRLKLVYYRALLRAGMLEYITKRETFEYMELLVDNMKELQRLVEPSIIMKEYFELISECNFLILIDDIKTGQEIDDTKPFDLKISQLIEHAEDGFIREMSIASLFDLSLQTNSTDLIEQYVHFADSIIQDPFLRNTVQSRYNRVKDFIENPGKYSVSVMNGVSVENSGFKPGTADPVHIVKDIIARNPDKVLYVDVWAPWCAPCVRQMAHSEQLADYFAGKPVLFVYLCVGGSQMEWKEVTEKYNLSGEHHYLTTAQSQDVMKRFSIKGIPHYLLFDKEGTLVNFGNHLVPRLQATKEAIERLIE